MTNSFWRPAWALVLLVGCGDASTGEAVGNSKVVPLDEAPAGSAAPIPQVVLEPAMVARADGPMIGAVQMVVTIYSQPDRRSPPLGYLRVGARIPRGEQPAAHDSCQGGFYNVLPRGFVCVDDGATTDMEHPLMRAELEPPNHEKPLPYDYAFVRAIAPRYYRMPNKQEQFQYEMALDRNLRSYERLRDKWTAYEVGSNDVPMLPDGTVLGPPPDAPPEMNIFERFGGGADGKVPWFFDGSRALPNIANFKVPDYAIITNRIKRHAGVAVIDAFEGEGRDFAMTTDLRLIPISKLKPGRGSLFHGVELTEGFELPVGFVKKQDGADVYEKQRGQYRRKRERLAYGTPVQLTGEVHKDGSRRYVETEDREWMLSDDLATAPLVSKLPAHAKPGVKWIDISIQRQSLVLYDGVKAIYATMVSTGKDGLGDPTKTHSTPRGLFHIRDKHVTATMDNQTLGQEFELNDVPWVQYFKAGYALHAAYWHTEYGRARSHGCVNMSPIDAYRIFKWTDPPLPEKWHSVVASETTGEGTLVYIHP